jgi:L-seryl-tRNA(Ser) seleniumtransferase
LVVPGDAIAQERRLRCGEPPVIGRIESDRLVLDLRTVFSEEEEQLLARLREA